MKTIVTLDKADSPYGFPQLDGSGNLQATGSLYGTSSYALDSITLNGTESIVFAITGSNLFTDNQTIDAGASEGFGSGIKFTNPGFAHYTAGVSGSTFVIADTSANYYSPWAGADIKLQIGATDSTFNTNVKVTGSNGYILLSPTIGSPNSTIQEIHANDEIPWIARFYNDTFSTTNSVMSYFGWSDGRFVFHNDTTQSIGLQVNGYSGENGLLVYQDKVAFVNNIEATGSISAPSITGSLFGTSSYAETASYASYAPLYLPLTGGTIDGNVTINGTASISFLNVTYESASVIFSSGSNQFGDSTNDIQTLVGTVRVSGSAIISGSLTATQGITGSLLGTSSWATNAQTASYVLQAVSSSFAINASTSSNILGGKATHIPYFVTDTTLATSSLYQSGSTSIIINQDNNTTANPEALYVWQPHPTSFNVISGKGDINNYLQLNIQNTNQGVNASSDIVATANNGNENDNYIDMGINSQNFNGFLGGPNDSYLYTHGHNFWVGNINDGYNTYFFNSSSLLPIITLDSNSARITGSLFGTASWATNANVATTALNGGVTQILAGTNVILSPTNGLGQVTINATGGNSGFNTATGSYGSFYNTGSVLATSATRIYSMSLSNTDISNGVFVSSSNGDTTKIKFTNAGVYNVQFSAQFSNTDNSTQDVIVWARKNGTDIPDSSGTVGVPPFKAGSNGQALASWNYYLNLSANDHIQLCWHTETANVITLETIAAGTSPTHPRTPSLILTAQRVDTFLSNTGSFLGTFTGDLIGTASYATTSSYTQNAQSASYALTASYALNGGGGGSGNGFPFTGTAQITGSLIVTNTIQLDQSLIDYSSVNSSIVGNNNLYQTATGSYTSAFTKYVVSNGTNARAGEFVTVWNGTTVVNYDNSTTDIGNTSDVTFASSIVTSQIKIDAGTATSGWKIKSTTTFI